MHGADQRLAQFAPQMVDMHLQRVAVDFLAPAVDALFQLHAAQDAPALLDEHQQDAELLARHGHLHAALAHLARGDVDDDIAMHEFFVRAPGRAAAGAAHARRQLIEVEGFDDEVVRARIQTGHPVDDLIARRDDQDRPVIAAAAQGRQRLHAILARQGQVEQQTAIAVQAHGHMRAFGRLHPVDRIAGLLQPHLRGAPQLGVVFCQQYAHRGLSCLNFMLAA